MGQFRVIARLTGPTGRMEAAEVLVDTGATFLVVPRSLADRLEIVPQRCLPVLIAGGTETTWPVGEVRVAIDGQETTTPCFIAPNGPALLGAVALESLLLTVDPVAKRLVPTKGYVLSATDAAGRYGGAVRDSSVRQRAGQPFAISA